MTAKVFIDGEVGTTGLQIRARLETRPDISLISLPEENRKSRLSRIGAFGEADIAILCLPDAAVHEIAPDLRSMPVRVIDASTAHRTDPDWIFGFAEMASSGLPKWLRASARRSRAPNSSRTPVAIRPAPSR